MLKKIVFVTRRVNKSSIFLCVIFEFNFVKKFRSISVLKKIKQLEIK